MLAVTLAAVSQPKRLPNRQVRSRSASNLPSAVPACAATSATSRIWRSAACSSRTGAARVTHANAHLTAGTKTPDRSPSRPGPPVRTA
eukprot:4092919-Pyramimonas_sp.AAC.1